MIFLHNIFIQTEEDLNDFCDMIKAAQENEEYEQDDNLSAGIDLYLSYVKNIFDLSVKLQDDVSTNISDDLETCVCIPYEETDDFDKLQFYIAAEDDRKVRQREQVLFNSYCDKYFKNTAGLMSLFVSSFPD